jgi:hypothetical protein
MAATTINLGITSTLAGLSSSNAQFATGTGTANGIDYLLVTRIA